MDTTTLTLKQRIDALGAIDLDQYAPPGFGPLPPDTRDAIYVAYLHRIFADNVTIKISDQADGSHGAYAVRVPIYKDRQSKDEATACVTILPSSYAEKWGWYRANNYEWMFYISPACMRIENRVYLRRVLNKSEVRWLLARIMLSGRYITEQTRFDIERISELLCAHEPVDDDHSAGASL